MTKYIDAAYIASGHNLLNFQFAIYNLHITQNLLCAHVLSSYMEL